MLVQGLMTSSNILLRKELKLEIIRKAAKTGNNQKRARVLKRLRHEHVSNYFQDTQQ